MKVIVVALALFACIVDGYYLSLTELLQRITSKKMHCKKNWSRQLLTKRNVAVAPSALRGNERASICFHATNCPVTKNPKGAWYEKDPICCFWRDNTEATPKQVLRKNSRADRSVTTCKKGSDENGILFTVVAVTLATTVSLRQNVGGSFR